MTPRVRFSAPTSARRYQRLALASKPAGAKLGRTLSVKASKGVAPFSGLTLNKVGTGYTLQVSSSGLSGAVSNAINVTSAAQVDAVAALAPSTVNGTGGTIANGSLVNRPPVSVSIGPVESAPAAATTLPEPGLVLQALESPDFLDCVLPRRHRR